MPDIETRPQWNVIESNGSRREVELTDDFVHGYASDAAKTFGVGKSKSVSFDRRRAQEDVKKADKKSAAS